MDIKIKLLDPKYCNGCPLYETLYGFRCRLFKEDIKIDYKEGLLIRPQKCIKENGE